MCLPPLSKLAPVAACQQPPQQQIPQHPKRRNPPPLNLPDVAPSTQFTLPSPGKFFSFSPMQKPITLTTPFGKPMILSPFLKSPSLSALGDLDFSWLANVSELQNIPSPF